MLAITAGNTTQTEVIVGVHGGSVLLWKDDELRLRPAPWNECFYAKLATYMQFGIFVLAMFLAPLLGYPAWPVLVAGIAVLAGYPLTWAMRQTILTKIVAKRDGDRLLISGHTPASPGDVTVQVRRDLLCGWILLMTVAVSPGNQRPAPPLRLMGHMDPRPVEALAEAIEKELGLVR